MMSGGGGSKAPSVQETWEGRYEQLMEQFAQVGCVRAHVCTQTHTPTRTNTLAHAHAHKHAPPSHCVSVRCADTHKRKLSPPHPIHTPIPAQDMCLYMRMVCDTIVTTVPKSVVHCLVRKAEKNLLNHLFGYVHKMTPDELKRMLQASTLGDGLGLRATLASSVPSLACIHT